MRHISAQASRDAAESVSLMKSTQVGSGFLQCSRTVPVRELNLAPHRGQRHLCTEAAVSPSLQGEGSPQAGHAGSGRYSRAASASVPNPASSRSMRSLTASCRSSRSPADSPSTSPE